MDFMGYHNVMELNLSLYYGMHMMDRLGKKMIYISSSYYSATVSLSVLLVK